MILKLILLLFLLTRNCLTETNFPNSMYGVGSRIEGDHLLVTDTLNSPTQSVKPQNHTIEFQYPLIDQVISYIEFSSNSNVKAEFILSIDEKNSSTQMLKGTVTAIQALEFWLKISVFGFNSEDKPNFQSILYPKIDLTGSMDPKYDGEGVDDIENEYYDDDYEDENILIVGDRQPGDELIYETIQYSQPTDIRSNHSVNFYYIDANYITLAKFTTIETTTAAAIYSHVTDHSLKAVIYDTNTHSLDVKLELYGYKPENLPTNYYPPLPSLENPIDGDNKNQSQLNEIINLPLSPSQIISTTNNSIECKTNNGIKIKSEIFYLYNIFIGLIFIKYFL